MKYIGIDVHKRICSACLMDEHYKTEKELLNVETTDEGLSKIAEMARPEDCFILMENSTRTHYVVRFFRKSGYSVFSAQAKDLVRITKSDAKTDRIDARKLAEYAREYRIWEERNSLSDDFFEKPPFRICNSFSEEELRIKTLCRMKFDLSEERAAIQKKLKEYMSMQNYFQIDFDRSVKGKRILSKLLKSDEPVLMSYASKLLDIMGEEEELEMEIESVMGDRKDVKLLMTVKGIGFASAAYICSSVVDITRFPSADAFVKYIGINPITSESAGKDRKKSISREGDARMRKILYRIVLVHGKFCKDSELSKYRKRMVKEHGFRVGTVAAGRKLACIIWSMLTHNEPFRAAPER